MPAALLGVPLSCHSIMPAVGARHGGTDLANLVLLVRASTSTFFGIDGLMLPPPSLQVIPTRLPEFSLDHLTDLVEDLNKLG